MAEYITGMNPAIIKWARERSGYSLEAAAAVIKKDVATLSDWESGGSAPTYVQLEKLADKYKRPVAIFFFPEPPEEPDVAGNLAMRSTDAIPLPPSIRILMRQAYARQISLMELSGGVNPAADLIFRSLRATLDVSAIAFARKTRAYMDVSVETQMGWHNPKEAFKRWRDIIEENGIFVFKDAFQDDTFDGFCLAHEEFPIIYLNNSRPAVRQTFSLFHELAHLLLGKDGITRGNRMHGGGAVEHFCNQFASEFLVPDLDLETRLTFSAYDDDAIETLANRYKVSRPVILFKLVNKGILTQEDSLERTEAWSAAYEAHKGREGGGSYYNTRAAYLGYRFMELAFSKYHQGQCSIEQLAEHLNVNVKNLPGLEDRLQGRANR